MAAPTIPLGPCPVCGHQLWVGKKYCGGCGREIDTNALLQSTAHAQAQTKLPYGSPFLPTLSSNSISDPLDLPNPSEQNVYRALVSPVNPYASWGTLVYEAKTDADGYSGNVLRLGGYSYGTVNFIIQEGPFRDFAYQVQIQLGIPRQTGQQAYGGIIFRSDANGTTYYAFSINDRETANLGRNDYQLITYPTYLNKLSGGECSAIRSGKPNLLAVVAQENVLDLYVNLRHIDRIYDTAYLHAGFIGIQADAMTEIYATHAKIWVKDERAGQALL